MSWLTENLLFFRQVGNVLILKRYLPWLFVNKILVSIIWERFDIKMVFGKDDIHYNKETKNSFDHIYFALYLNNHLLHSHFLFVYTCLSYSLYQDRVQINLPFVIYASLIFHVYAVEMIAKKRHKIILYKKRNILIMRHS